MPTLADSLVSSTARPLNVKMRPDLEVREQRYQGTPYWVIKDPVGLNYFRFQEEEFTILEWLDGETSLDELKRRFEKQFAPQKIGVDELGRLIGTLHRSNLVLADLPGQGPQLLKRRAQRTKQKIIGAMSNILAIRFKGIDPEWMLTGLLPYVRWFFTWPAGIACMVLWLSALLLVGVQFDVFMAKLPTFHQFFAAENWIYLGVAMALTKVIHEFGHGLSCKHFGGECHEMGAMLLVFTPCLYCNVSDSWMLPSKWQRAFIGFAGIYVEWCIAAIATFIWWFSEPGTLNQLALSTMFVCSVSTFLFNINPLMRYDGYYILSDLMEVPNLRQKASSMMSRKLGKWCLGLKEPDDPFLPQRHRWLFYTYAIASPIYLWLVTFSILWFLYKVFEPYRLEIIGQILACISLVSLVGMPLYKLGRFFYLPGRIDQVKKPRLYATLAVVAAVIAAIVLIPFPYRVHCPVEVRAASAVPVYVDVPGDIATVGVKPGQQVKAGDEIARLVNQDLEMQIVKMQGKRDQLQTELNSLRRQHLRDSQSRAGEQVATTQEMLSAVKEQLRELEVNRQRLTLRAAVSGTVIAPESQQPQGHEEELRLPAWTGTPMDEKNLGATLESGRVFCLIGNPGEMDATLVVDQSETDFIHRGQEVDIKIDALPAETFSTTLVHIASEPLEFASKQLSNKAYGELETVTDEQGRERPLITSYPALVFLQDPEGVLRPGMRGRAKVYAGYQTLGQRFWRYLTQTFNFEM